MGAESGRRSSGLVSSEVPGQQFINAVDGVIGDALEHVSQVRLGIEPFAYEAQAKQANS